jgi:hypothetical protein
MSTIIKQDYDAARESLFAPHIAGLKKVFSYMESNIVELNAALDKAAHQLYDYSGSCPSDLYDWEHPNTCIRECNRYDSPDEAWKCWRLWLLEKPREGE